MNTATTTAGPTATACPILALDPGKYKTVACAYPGDPVAARFESLTTNCQHLRQLFAMHRPAVVVFEACALSGNGGNGKPSRRPPTVLRAADTNQRTTRNGPEERRKLAAWPSKGRGKDVRKPSETFYS